MMMIMIMMMIENNEMTKNDITIMVLNCSNSKVVNVMSVYLVLSIFAAIFNGPHVMFL